MSLNLQEGLISVQSRSSRVLDLTNSRCLSKHQLSGFSLDELRRACREHNIFVSGNKYEHVKAIHRHWLALDPMKETQHGVVAVERLLFNSRYVGRSAFHKFPLKVLRAVCLKYKMLSSIENPRKVQCLQLIWAYRNQRYKNLLNFNDGPGGSTTDTLRSCAGNVEEDDSDLTSLDGSEGDEDEDILPARTVTFPDLDHDRPRSISMTVFADVHCTHKLCEFVYWPRSDGGIDLTEITEFVEFEFGERNEKHLSVVHPLTGVVLVEERYIGASKVDRLLKLCPFLWLTY